MKRSIYFSTLFSALWILGLITTSCRPTVVIVASAPQGRDTSLLELDPSRSAAGVLDNTLIAGEQTTVVVQLVGTDGNAWTENVTVTLALNDNTYGTLGAVSVYNPGVYHAAFTGIKSDVTIRITASVDGSPLTSAPTSVTVSAPPAPTSLVWNAGAAVTNDINLTSSWTKSSATNIAAQQIEYYTGLTCNTLSSTVDLADANDQTDSFTGSNGLAYSFKVVSIDVGGNEATSACSSSILVDTTSPSLAITAPSASAFINSSSDSTLYPVSGTCSEPGQTLTLKVDGSDAGTASCSSGNFSGTINTTGLNEGAHTLSASLNDLAGNSANSTGIAITKDTTAPTVTGLSNDATPTISKSWNWGCDGGPCTYLYLIDNTADSNPTGTFGATTSTSQSAGTGTYYLHVQAKDESGNTSSVVHVSTILDNSGPGNPSLSINAGATYTPSNSVDLTLAADNAPSQMYITNTAGCASGGNWEAYNTSKTGWTLGQTNDTATVYAKFKDASSNESGCTSDTIIHDNTAPTLSFTSPAADTTAATGLTIGGLCEAGLTVNLSGTGLASPASTSCADGSYSQAIIFSANDGAKNIIITQTDAAGNEGSSNRNFLQDTSGPTSPTLSIDAGATYTKLSAVNLTLSANGSPTEMYVTHTAGCASGGNWEAYGTSKAGWTLAQTNATATIYVKFRDTLNNESDCVDDTIVHDDQAPILAFSSPAANTAGVSGLTIAGSCEAGLTVNLSGIGLDSPTSTSCTAGTFSQAIVFAAGEGVKNIIVSQTDAASNEGSADRDFMKDSSGPGSPSLSINAGASYTTSSSVTLTLSATGSPTEMYITDTADCAGGGAWEAYNTSKEGHTLAQSNATATVYVKFRDALLNESTCASDSIVHDNNAPSLSFSSPAADTVAVSGVTITGACEGTTSIMISGTGLDSPSSATCTDGTSFSQAIIFTTGEGTKNIVITQTDAAGNEGTTNRNFIKDSTAPSSPTISINSDDASTTSTSVTLTLSAAGSPDQMYVTNTADCAGGGSWESYATSKSNWTLAQASGTATVYVKYRDAVGNESTCVNDTITVELEVGGPITLTYSDTATTYFDRNIFVDAQNAALASPPWNGTTTATINVIINANVKIGATTTSTPALTTNDYTTQTFPADTVITITNNGLITGAGGAGGAAATVGAIGGNGLALNYAVSLTNNGTIAGGGGGGGGGISGCYTVGTTGGAGAGLNEAGGATSTQGAPGGDSGGFSGGAAGSTSGSTSTAGGPGISSGLGSNTQPSCTNYGCGGGYHSDGAGTGGGGGGLGYAGGTGYSGKAGGLGGYAIAGTIWITNNWSASGIYLGRNSNVASSATLSSSPTFSSMCSPSSNVSNSDYGRLLDSGGLAGNYQDYQDCTLVIQPAGATSLTFTINSFDTETGFDYLYIYSGYSGTTCTGALIWTGNGLVASGTQITVNSSTACLLWRTDDSVTKAGFDINWDGN